MADTLFIRLPSYRVLNRVLGKGVGDADIASALEGDIESPEDGLAQAALEIEADWAYYQDQQLHSGDVRSPLADIYDTVVKVRESFVGVKVIAIVPSTDLTLCQAHVPSKQASQVLQALPYALEDTIAEDVETMHFAITPPVKGSVNVAVVAKAGMQRWLQALNAAQMPPELMVPDLFYVPLETGAWSILLDNEHALVRSSTFSGLSLERSELVPMLSAMIQEHEAIDDSLSLRVLSPESDMDSSFGTDLLENELSASSELSVRFEHTHLAQSSLRELCQQHWQQSDKQRINLLQGSYTPSAKRGQSMFNWKPVAMLGSVLLILQLGMMIGNGIYYQNQADALSEQKLSLYKSLYPRDNNVNQSTAKRRMEKKLLAAAGGSREEQAFLELFAEAARVVNQSNRSDKEAIVTKRVSFDKDLRIDVLAKDFSVLESLKQGLLKRGLLAEIASATQDGDVVKGRLKIQGGGAAI